MVKALLFDLDQTLIALGPIHHKVLNQAIEDVAGKAFKINKTEHENIYNGLPTRVKLAMLTERKNLPVELHERIEAKKQEFTIRAIHKHFEPQHSKVVMCRFIKEGLQLKIGCVSNSVRPTVEAALKSIGILKFFDIIVSNEDVVKSKPDPEPYKVACHNLGIEPFESIAFEDHPKGLKSALIAGCKLWWIPNPNFLTIDTIEMATKTYND